jgi:hypothetical protein
VLVDWDDAFTAVREWMAIDALDEFARDRGFEAQDVGWVTRLDPRHLMIHATRADSEDQVAGVRRIPWGCIRKITVLRRARADRS